MCWMEIQEGRDAMRAKYFSRELGVTAACVKRAVVEAGKFFSLSKKPASDADVDPKSLESNPAEEETEHNLEIDNRSKEE